MVVSDVVGTDLIIVDDGWLSLNAGLALCGSRPSPRLFSAHRSAAASPEGTQ